MLHINDLIPNLISIIDYKPAVHQFFCVPASGHLLYVNKAIGVCFNTIQLVEINYTVR